MATPPNTVIGPELLRKDNYRKWSVCMRHYFVAQDLWEVVDDPKGSVEEEEERSKEWRKKNALALYAITASCGEEMFDRIEAADTARDAWIKLAQEAAAPPTTSVPPPEAVAQPLSRGEIEEVDATNDGRNRLAHEGPRPVKTETENEWRRSLLDMIHKEDYWSCDFKKFFKEHQDANLNTALHDLATFAGQLSDSSIFGFVYSKLDKSYKELIGMICDIETLVAKDESGNTLASNAVRHGRESLIKLLIQKNKELLAKDDLQLLLTNIPDADGKIPVQLACELGNKDITQFLYIETPAHFLHPKNGEYGFHLIKECISKKMFEIALHLLYQIPELRFSLDGTTILLTMAQFSPKNHLPFWNRWLYHCINFEVKLRPSKESANDQNSGGQLNKNEKIGFYVYARILGIRWKNWSILKAASSSIRTDDQQKTIVVHNQQFVEAAADQQQQQHNEKADEDAKPLVDQADQQQEGQQRDVEANLQTNNCYDNGFLIKVKKGCMILLGALTVFCMLLVGLGLDLLISIPLRVIFLLPRPVVLSLLEKLSRLIGFRKTHDLKLNHVYINEIMNVISKQLKGLGTKELIQNGAMEATFLAIKNHIPEIAIEFIKANENMLRHCSDLHDPERNVLVTTVINRQENVAKYLYYELDIKNAINIMDEDGNNMLHLAAKLAPRAQLTHISGAALQLQSELHWFKGVEGIVPSFQKDSKNKKKETPFEMFATEHEGLRREAEEWLKKASESSTVVGALIITIMFTAAFTVPGGNNQDTGLPIFSHSPPFFIFIIADAISLFAAATSVLMFLGILTSRYALEDFIKSLPIKLILGLSSLFISITAMMAAFCATLFIMLRGQLGVVVPITLLAAMMATFCAALFIMLPGRLRVVTPITLIAGIPVTSFVLLQFPLLLEILYSTYNADIFKINSKKSMLWMLPDALLIELMRPLHWHLDAAASYKDTLRSNKDRWIDIFKM